MRLAKKHKSLSPEFEFFINAPLSRYEGMYVALLGKKVISSGTTAKEAWDKARKKNPKSLPTIAKIPKKEVMVLIWR